MVVCSTAACKVHNSWIAAVQISSIWKNKSMFGFLCTLFNEWKAHDADSLQYQGTQIILYETLLNELIILRFTSTHTWSAALSPIASWTVNWCQTPFHHHLAHKMRKISIQIFFLLHHHGKLCAKLLPWYVIWSWPRSVSCQYAGFLSVDTHAIHWG